MRWTIGAYEFDEDTKLLATSDGEVILEPKAAALLAYFCNNPNRNVGRDELLEAVWYGQVVSDNSINRIIVLLRKALKDENKVRHYIATVPKLGYKFIADVSEVGADESNSTASTAHLPAFSSRQWLAILTLFAVLVLGAVLFLTSNTKPVAQSNPSIAPLSRLAVTQSNADLASDGKSLLYSASNEQGTAIFLSRDDLSEPVRISAPDGYADYAKWANGGEFIIYMYINDNGCEFHKVDIVQGQPREPTVLYQCANNSYTEFAFSKDNSKVYFVERTAIFGPYSAYELDLIRQSKRRLSQPLTKGLGNHFLDVHPTTGEVLVLSDQSPGKTTAYVLNVENDSFSQRHELGYHVESAVWSHRDDYIVHPSTHPSYQLLETNLTSGKSQLLVSDSRRITHPRRIPSASITSQDYLFTSYVFNRDIKLSDGDNTTINSTVMDYLPALSQSGNQLAFVSKRSGYSKIWIKELSNNRLNSFEPVDKGRRYFSLAWSENDDRILANTDTGILVYSLASQNYTHDIAITSPAYHVAWHDEHTLSYSQFEELRWQLYYYDLRTNSISADDQGWAFSLKNNEQHVFLDQKFTASRDGVELTELAACAYPVVRFRLRYQIDGGNIYCHAAGDGQDLLKFDADMSMTRLPNVVSRFEYFSTRDGKLATTVVNSSHSDIMRTIIRQAD